MYQPDVQGPAMLPKSKEILKLKLQGQQAKEEHIESPTMAMTAGITVALSRDESRVEQVCDLHLLTYVPKCVAPHNTKNSKHNHIYVNMSASQAARRKGASTASPFPSTSPFSLIAVSPSVPSFDPVCTCSTELLALPSATWSM